ncbi:MAG: tRNA lysidine(34) synthetase TilS [Eubacteriales bacterium]
MDKVNAYMRRHALLNMGDTLLLGVSGGADSIALLHYFYVISQEYHLMLYVAHLNHSLRDQASDGDEKFVKELCRDYKIKCFTKKINVQEVSDNSKTSIEETGRNLRYHFFDELCGRYNINKIVLAHHRDDQTETIVMRMIRGTGLKGLRGILPRRGKIIRPFLCVSKKEILNYCCQHRLKYRQDLSNFDTDYHRNQLRLEVIPMMKKLNKNFSNNIFHLGTISQEYYEYVTLEMEKIWSDVIIEGKLSISHFKKLHIALQREVIFKMISKYSSRDIGFGHIQIILDKVEEDLDTTWKIDLPNGIRVIRRYQFLCVENNILEDFYEYSYEILPNKTYIFPKINITLKTEIILRSKRNDLEKNNLVAYFDYDKIILLDNKLLLRNRMDGDRISPEGMKGTKKIKDIFIDKKIPINKRCQIPILTVNNDILWVLGYHKSKKYRVDENTRQMIVITFCNYKEDMLSASGNEGNSNR